MKGFLEYWFHKINGKRHDKKLSVFMSEMKDESKWFFHYTKKKILYEHSTINKHSWPQIWHDIYLKTLFSGFGYLITCDKPQVCIVIRKKKVIYFYTILYDESSSIHPSFWLSWVGGSLNKISPSSQYWLSEPIQVNHLLPCGALILLFWIPNSLCNWILFILQCSKFQLSDVHPCPFTRGD